VNTKRNFRKLQNLILTCQRLYGDLNADRLVQMSAKETASDVADTNETGKVLPIFRANPDTTGVGVWDKVNEGQVGDRRYSSQKPMGPGETRSWPLTFRLPF